MKHFTKTVLAASFCVLAAVPAYGGHKHGANRIWDRLERQHYRIDQGVETGELTRKEAKVLRKQHRRIHRLARELRDEGGFSPKQRRILRRKLDKASDLIWTLKHNEDYRYARRHEWRQDRWDWDDDSSSWQSEPGSWLYFGFTGW